LLLRIPHPERGGGFLILIKKIKLVYGMSMANNENNFEEKRREAMEQEVNQKIFDLVEKPKGFLFVKSTNVFHDRYRVNVYAESEVETYNGYKGQRISNSYFCKYDGENLTIIA